MTNLISTAPYVLQALLELAQAAAAAQSPAVTAFPFELATYEPASYVIVKGFENHRWQWESLRFAQLEYYDIHGLASIYTGASQVDQTVALDTMFATYSLFQAVVMTPIMSNLTAPIFGNVGPVGSAVNQVYPIRTRYTGGLGEMAGGNAGWYGEIDWAFEFVAYVTPA